MTRFTEDPEVALMIFNNAIANRQPEPRSVCLCGKKRFKNIFDITCGNAAAVVGNLDMDTILLRIHSTLYSDQAAIINSMQRIEQEINKDLFDLIFVQK